MIEVLHNFGGKMTNEKRILPGIYEDDDEALFGLADYLIANKHARLVGVRERVSRAVVNAVSQVVSPPEEDETQDVFNLTPPAEVDVDERPVKKGKK